MEIRARLIFRFPAILMMLVLSACGGGMEDLEQYIASVKERPGGRIEPLPQIKPYENFDYSVQNMRSPFVQERVVETGKSTGPTPIKNRNKEYLEQFPLDTLNMVGTLEREGRMFGLVQAGDGLVHRVLPGNYIGQNDGKVISITESRIEVEELVPDGMGSFFKRSAGIGID